jgi:exonuclease SbcC
VPFSTESEWVACQLSRRVYTQKNPSTPEKRLCPVKGLPGGQFVLVNEAVNLGISIYNMRQGEGIRYETLFRDETVGALDAVNGKEHVRMLRRAMDLGGFHQVIFICHTSLVWELADSILSIGGGRVVMGDQQAAPTD